MEIKTSQDQIYGRVHAIVGVYGSPYDSSFTSLILIAFSKGGLISAYLKVLI